MSFFSVTGLNGLPFILFHFFLIDISVVSGRLNAFV